MLLNPEEIAAKEDGQLRLYSVMVTDVTHMERSVRDLFARRIESCLGFEVESDFEGAGEEQVALQGEFQMSSLCVLPASGTDVPTERITANAIDRSPDPFSHFAHRTFTPSRLSDHHSSHRPRTRSAQARQINRESSSSVNAETGEYAPRTVVLCWKSVQGRANVCRRCRTRS